MNQSKSQSPSSAYETDLQARWDRLATARSTPVPTPAVGRPAQPFPHHLRFGADGNAAEYCVFGWHRPEGDFTWTNCSEAVLELPAPPVPGSYLLNLMIAPFTAGPIHRQELDLVVRGDLLARWSVHHSGHYFALLFETYLAEPQEIVFRVPGARSPRELGINGDERRLGIRFYQLWLTPWEGVSL